MPEPSKITILLADEDALRRDGLAAVLAGAEDYEVVASVPDGNAALQEIHDRRPDVAVVDLNLAGMHAIELVRRIRAESIPTRVVVIAGTSDDEIVREVVRAGGDGYLLKNGPARHLLDAISYVSDGGQYFSPQLHRDGRDRHLLQEPARQPAGVGVWRERIREEAQSSNLEDRDYEIMSMMADGIRPILDRLDEIDNRVALMEVGDAPLPPHPREWLNYELAGSLGNDAEGQLAAQLIPQSAGELEARLPEIIEEAVTIHFNRMAGRLQQQIEETHVRTLETFVKNIQVKLVRRVSALETDMSKQAEAMGDLRDSTQRTEDNLSRLIHGVDRLAKELPHRLATAAPPLAVPPVAATPAFKSATPAFKRRFRASRRTRNMMLASLMATALLGLAGWGWWTFFGPAGAAPAPDSDTVSTAIEKATASPDAIAGATTTATLPANTEPPAANADSKTKIEAAKNYTDLKNYAMAEDMYKQVLSSQPTNVEALQGLASVLYREDKIDEAAAVLDRIPK